MELLEYQRKAISTAIYPSGGIQGIAYTALGLNGEAGEVAERIKKIVRDDEAGNSPDALDKAIAIRRDDIVKEMGDVLWYLAALSHELGVTLEEVALANVTKLRSRQERNVIKGSGDNR